MALLYLTKYGLSDFRNKLEKQNKDFAIINTKNNTYISIGKNKFYEGESNKGGFSIKELSLITSTKNQLKKFADSPLLEKDYTRIDYFNAWSSQLKRPEIFEDCAQIDINSAYLSVLKNCGAITEQLYNSFFEVEDISKMSARKLEFKKDNKDYRSRCGGILKVSKKCRLVSVGSVATYKIIQNYKGTEKNGKEIEKYNKKEANAFFYAAYLVGEIMQKAMKESGGFFYWVDCVFIPLRNLHKAIQVFKDNGVDFHYNECEIRFIPQRWNVKFSVTSKDTGELIDYFFRYSKSVNLKDFISDTQLILSIYSELLKNNDSCNNNEIAKLCNSINLQVIDLYKIKDYFIELEGIKGNIILKAIFLAVKNDIGIMFEHWHNDTKSYKP